MSDVQRYANVYWKGSGSHHIVEDQEGEYVKFEDYEALQADAERYRWLRSEGLSHIAFDRLTPDTCDIGLDHAIDVARGSPPPASGEQK